MWGFR